VTIANSRRQFAHLLRGSEDKSTVSIHRIFKGYRCATEPGSAMHRLLKEYDWLWKLKEHHIHLYPDIVSSPIGQKELRYLREDCDFELKFLDEN
jgi:hypothetical protein